MNAEQVPVLIVGAGGSGLSLSLLLLQQRVHSLVVERREDISWYPRARNLNFRTLEVFRALGLSEDVHAAGTPVSRIFVRPHLASREQKELLDTASLLDTTALSPEPFMWYCPQSRLEPLLLKAARARGADVRYSNELIAFNQDDGGITATVRDKKTNESRDVRAQFLIGADGAHSHVREQAKIPTQGKGTLDEHYVFIYFRAPWDEFIRGMDNDAILIEDLDVRGMFLIAEKDLGMFALTQGKEAAEITRESAVELLRKAIGKPEINIEVIEVAAWQPEQRVAEVFQQGRVFLVGDAAHTMPPKEGLGANTAIQSAQNLAWKMAAVIKGNAGPELLSTYQTERHPVAWFETEYSMTGPGAAVLDKTQMEEKPSEFFPIVGYRYRSSAIVSEDNPPTPPDEIVLLDREELTGIPGTRVPFVWFERGAQQVSTLDVLDGRFVLLSGNDEQWSGAAARVNASLPTDLIGAYKIGNEGDLRDPENSWNQKMGISQDGAVLIRPDGFVAWRSKHFMLSSDQLEEVLGRILCRTTPIGTPRTAKQAVSA